jgi:hypothetical protein
MQAQRKLCQAFLEIIQEALRVLLVLEADDRIIGIPHDDHVAGGVPQSPLLDPEIIDVVQVDVRKEWGCHRTLRNPFPRLHPEVLFQHTRLQPFLDQADDPAITDPMFDETHQPFPAERVEERTDIGVEYPVDFACLDSVRERVQRIVLAASGSEPVAESQELRLVDRREDSHHGCLDDLVLNGSNAERPLSAIRLRYVLPARWQRSIRSGMNPCVKIGEVGLQICRVLVPRPAIDARGRALLQAEEGPFQNLDADVVQERGQLLLPVPGNSATYAGLRL